MGVTVMSVRTLDNGVRVITLGLGTVMTSEVRRDGEDFARYILFSGSTPPTGAASWSDLPPDAVLIEIFNARGALAYLRPLFGLLKTWTDSPIAPIAEQMEAEAIALIERLAAEADAT